MVGSDSSGKSGALHGKQSYFILSCLSSSLLALLTLLVLHNSLKEKEGAVLVGFKPAGLSLDGKPPPLWLDTKLSLNPLPPSFAGESKSKQVFFHASAFISSPFQAPLKIGQAVEVELGKDARGRPACLKVAPLAGNAGNGQSQEKGAAASSGGADDSVVNLPCFSMNMPFAGLVR